MLMLLPLVQGLNTTVPVPVQDGAEYILELDDGVWSQELWDSLDSTGHVPLRMIGPSHILVWRSTDYAPLSDVHTQQPPHTEYKFGLEHDVEFAKIVFEPRLPADAVSTLVRTFHAWGLSIESNPQKYSMPLPHIEIVEWSIVAQHLGTKDIDGVLWIEPVFSAEARNELSGSLLQHGKTTANPAWELGLNGDGIVVAAADSGIDYDHACFRNATSPTAIGSNGTDGVGTPGENHRKILAVNHSIDSGDTNGHSDYRHGTHVAGTLACYNVYDMRSSSQPKNGSALAYESKLVFQDIVSADGWVPPDVDSLFVEAGMNGAVIHSNSWGDATTEYTARTADFDAWALEMPWSLTFVAPGNNGAQLLEPANGRNVVAVGASMKSQSLAVWPSSSIGPTEAGTNGIFALAPGTTIQSARADGIPDSYNDALRSSSGTSMSTPAAAGTAALIQQMIEDGWISGSDNRSSVAVQTLRPVWSDATLNSTNHLQLSEGFTPSGSLLRALLSLSTTQLSQEERNGGDGGYAVQNIHDGWGQLNLSELVDFEALEETLHQGNASPASDLWIHDSYRLDEGSPSEWLSQRQGNNEALENLISAPWNGTGAKGPFLATDEVWTERFEPNGERLNVRLAWPAAPEPHMVDDLQLIVRLSDGTDAVAGSYQNDGDSTLYLSDVVDFSNTTTFPNRNETTVAITLSEDDLEGIEWIDVEVRARYVTPGNSVHSVGVDGNRMGFALAVQGVVRDSQAWSDSDGDGVVNMVDECPNQSAQGWDSDLDGCIDDTDGDSVNDPNDDCPETNSQNYDTDSDGCIDDSDGDGVLDNIDLCLTAVASVFWPVDVDGCRPVDVLPAVDFTLSPDNGGIWYDELVVEWMVFDDDGDSFDTGAAIHVLNNSSEGGSYSIARCTKINVENGNFSCTWEIPRDLPVWDIRGFDLQIELFVQSRNNSPEAKLDTVILRDDAVFTSQWNNPLLDGGTKGNDLQAEGGSSQNRALLWGIFGVIGGFVLMYQLGWNVRRDERDKKVRPAFDVDIEQRRGDLLGENE